MKNYLLKLNLKKLQIKNMAEALIKKVKKKIKKKVI